MASQAVSEAPDKSPATEPPPSESTPAAPSRRRALLIALIAGGLGGAIVGLASPPYDLHVLAFVGFAPVFVVAKDVRLGIVAGVACGVVWFGFELSWVFSLAWFGWVIVVGWLSLVVVALGAVAGWLRSRNIGFWWRFAIVPSAFVVAEWLQARWPGGFASQAGVTQHNWPLTRAIVAFGGIALVTWLIMAANVAFAEVFERIRDREQRDVRAFAVPVIALVGVVGMFVLGWFVRPQAAPIDSVSVAIVQANDLPGVDVPSAVLVEKHLAATRTLDGDYDTVLWSESSLGSTDIDSDLGADIVEASGGVPVLANSYMEHPTRPEFWNRNVLFGSDGEPEWTYDKRKLVPFGEYVPFREQLRWISVLQEGVPRDGIRGEEVGIFGIAGHPVGSLICFETAVGEFTREVVQEGAQAIVSNINNASYGFSHESEQFLAMARMRAAETHRAVALPAVSGQSATIDPSGDTTQVTELFETATLDWDMPLHDDKTIYIRFGEWVLYASMLVLAVGAGLFAARALRNRSSSSQT